MYYQNYEDYMRQVLGYPINDPNIYESYDYKNRQLYEDTYSSRNQYMSSMSEEEIRDCYPEIYNLVYPMVCKVCDTNTQPITRELIEKMTDEVYLAIEDSSTVVNIRVDTPKPEEKRSTCNSRACSSNITSSSASNAKKFEASSDRAMSREVSKSLGKDNSKVNRLEDNRTQKSKEERTSKISDEAISRESIFSITENRDVMSHLAESRQLNSGLRDLIKILILFRLFGNRPIRPRPHRPPFQGGTKQTTFFRR